jgi:hypothetical protein
MKQLETAPHSTLHIQHRSFYSERPGSTTDFEFTVGTLLRTHLAHKARAQRRPARSTLTRRESLSPAVCDPQRPLCAGGKAHGKLSTGCKPSWLTGMRRSVSVSLIGARLVTCSRDHTRRCVRASARNGRNSDKMLLLRRLARPGAFVGGTGSDVTHSLCGWHWLCQCSQPLWVALALPVLTVLGCHSAVGGSTAGWQRLAVADLVV